jgi:hypothetical protein
VQAVETLNESVDGVVKVADGEILEAWSEGWRQIKLLAPEKAQDTDLEALIKLSQDSLRIKAAGFKTKSKTDTKPDKSKEEKQVTKYRNQITLISKKISKNIIKEKMIK